MYGKAIVVLTNGATRILNPSTKPILPIIFTESLEMKSRKAMESRPILKHRRGVRWLLSVMYSRVQNFRLQSQTNESDLAPYQKDFFKKEGKRK